MNIKIRPLNVDTATAHFRAGIAVVAEFEGKDTVYALFPVLGPSCVHEKVAIGEAKAYVRTKRGHDWTQDGDGGYKIVSYTLESLS